MRRRASCAFALAATLVATSAAANPLGLDGYTGKGGADVTCNNCHTGGTAPSVTLTGPTALTAGQVAQYTLRVATGASIVGMAAAATDGVVLKPGTNTKQKFAEVAHASPLAPSGGAAQFTFNLTAPPYNGPITVWAVGNACNNNDSSSGDRAATTSLSVTISGGVEPPPPPPPPAGTGTSPPPGGATPPAAPESPTADGGVGTSADGGATGGGKPAGASGSRGGAGPESDRSPGFVGPDETTEGGLACTLGGRRGALHAWPLIALLGALLVRRRRPT